MAFRQEEHSPADGLFERGARRLHAGRPGASEAFGALNGTTALLFYLATYGIMTLGVFAILAAISPPGRSSSNIEDLAGLSRHHSASAFMMAILPLQPDRSAADGGLPRQAEPVPGRLVRRQPGRPAPGHHPRRECGDQAAYYYLRLIGAMYLQPGVGPSAELSCSGARGGRDHLLRPDDCAVRGSEARLECGGREAARVSFRRSPPRPPSNRRRRLATPAAE